LTLDNLAAEILDKAKAEADSIIKEAEEEASRIEEGANQEAAQFAETNTNRANRESTQLSVEIVASARQANQKRALIAKKEELDLTWERVKSEVSSPKLKNRNKILDQLIKTAKDENGSGMILRPVNIDRKALSDSGFKLGDDVEGLGGFILESKDGSAVMDYRFDYRLEMAWKNSLAEVNNILFG
tara:strand:+ start:1609 stop:2166 length:558 start_codon:yes stop_codon:yes gene_type:complete